MIPMIQTVQIKAPSTQTASGESTPQSNADDDFFSLDDPVSDPDQKDDPTQEDVIALPYFQGVMPPSVAKLPTSYDMKAQEMTAMLKERTALQRADSDEGAIETAPIAEEKAATNPESMTSSLQALIGPLPNQVSGPGASTIPVQSGPMAPGAVESALRIKWADFGFGDATLVVPQDGAPQLRSQLGAQAMIAASEVSFANKPIAGEIFPDPMTWDQQAVDLNIGLGPTGPNFSPVQGQFSPATAALPPGAPMQTCGLAQLPIHLASHAISGQPGQSELALNPEELGHLRFSIQHHGDKLTVILSAERPDTLSLLRQNAQQLLAEFATAGFTGTTLSFGKWGGGENPTPQRQQPTELASDQLVSAPPPSRSGPSQGLDLRL